MRLLINVLIWSLLVGLLLAWLRVSPVELLEATADFLAGVPAFLADLFGWAWPYIVTGAVIVVPITVLMLILRLFSKRRQGP